MKTISATLLASAATIALLGASSAAAQDASAASEVSPNVAAPPPPVGQGSPEPGDIVVTGSRIARSDLKSAVPVAIVSAASIMESGEGNIQDTLMQLPALGSNFLSRSNSNFATNGNGIATLNLRNLAQSRTLTLINGRRSVGIPGSSAVDVNNVPTDFIDHVEVTTGGASAVYGSDAIAGVVNFVLKDRFDGIRVRAQNTISDKGDDPRQLVSITAGQSFAADRGHIIANFTYDNDEGLYSRDRSFSAHDSSRSSYAAQGVFSLSQAFPLGGSTFSFTPDNMVKQYQGANVDGFDRNQARYLAVPVERLTGAALGSFEVTNTIKLYGEGEFTHTRSRASLEPLPVANSGPGAALNFDGTPFAGIPITNPFIPAQIRQAMVAAGVDVLQFRRRSNDIFSRSNKDARTYWRGVGGLKGDITPNWHFDVSVEHSETTETDSAANAYAPGYGAALNAITDASGKIVCADAAARAAGCVPLNIFGYNTASPEAAKFVTTYSGPTDAAQGFVNGDTITYRYHARVKQTDAQASVTGTLFDLPGGAATIAAGLEYRRESSSEVYDPYTQAGLTLGNQLRNTIGRYNVKEAFAEAVLPILADRPFAEYLGLEAAFRHGDYSTVGGVNSYKLAAEYAPTRDIRFRGTYASATRAPNIADLYASQSQTFFGGIDDPCDQSASQGDLGSPTRALPDACKQIPGVTSTIAKNGSFAYTTAQLQAIDGLLGGNSTLKAETAHTITAGAILTPRLVRGFSLSADYYHIKVKHAIGQIDPNVSVQECLNSGNPVFCGNVTRDAGGFVIHVNSINLNAGSYIEAGLDLQGRYATRIGSDQLELTAYWNHLFKQQTVAFPGGPVQKEVGQTDSYSGGRLGSGFHNKVYVTTTYTHGGLSFNYRVNYYSPLVTQLGDPDAEHLKAVFYHDVQARVGVGPDKRFALYGGVNNLLDRKPPHTSDLNSVTWPGSNTIASTYDVFGRMLYVGAEVKF